MSRNHLTMAVIVIIAALLTGCVGSSVPTASSPAPSQTASSAASPEPTTTQPVLAFGGECDNVLPVAEAASIVGVDASASVASSPETEWRYPLETAGGLFCTWDGNDEYLEVVSLPVERVPADLAGLYSAPGCVMQYDWSECSWAREHGGIWTLAVLKYGWEVPPVPTAKLDAVLSIAEEQGGTFTAAQAVTPGPQTWALPECATLAEKLDVASLLGPSEVFEGLMTEGPGPLDKRIAAAIGSIRECGWSTLDAPFAQLAVVVEPDAGWSFAAQQSRHSSSEPVEIDGASSAIRTRDGEFSEGLLMTDTVNILRVDLTPADGDANLATKILQLMGSVG